MSEVKNIYQRLLSASQELGYIKKNGRNQMQNYDYVQASDVIAESRKACFKHGIVVIPSVLAMEKVGEFSAKSGTVHMITRAQVKLTAINVDVPEEKLEVITFGDGADSGDKSPYKAMTGAEKYGFIYLLNLPQGDDPEHDGHENSGKSNPKESVKPPLKKSDVEKFGEPDWTETVLKKERNCHYCNQDIKVGEKCVFHAGLRQVQHLVCREAESKLPF